MAKHIVLEEGDIQAGFAAADVVLEREFSTSTIHQGYIEPHNATAVWRADETLELHCSTQGHFGVRNEISQMLGIPVSNILGSFRPKSAADLAASSRTTWRRSRLCWPARLVDR